MPYTQYTLAELRTRLADRWEHSPFWTEPDADQAINDALRSWNALTGYWRGRVIVRVPPGDAFAAIPSRLTQDVTVGYQGYPLVYTPLEGLNRCAPNWITDTTATGGGVPIRPLFWSRIGIGLLIVWPAPAAGGTFDVDGVVRTPALAGPEDYLNADSALVPVLLDEALSLAALKAGSAAVAATAPGHLAFLAEVAKRVPELRCLDTLPATDHDPRTGRAGG